MYIENNAELTKYRVFAIVRRTRLFFILQVPKLTGIANAHTTTEESRNQKNLNFSLLMLWGLLALSILYS